jgi:CBS domain-containing protein
MKGFSGAARRFLHHTPLFAIEAVALDTETTGLDPRTARIIEIGAVRIPDHGGEDCFQSFVAIAEPIPEAATSIHGIRDADLTGAPDFPTVFARLARFVGDRPVIGHTISFDIALLGKECAGAGLALPNWPLLDVRLLAGVAAPTVADFSLEGLAAWLGLEVTERHRALADALLAARIFTRLAPLLRDAGIHTVGQAHAACRDLTHSPDATYRATWLESTSRALAEDPYSHVRNTYPYRHRVREIMSAPPAFAAEDEAIGQVLASMIDRQVSSNFIGAQESPAGEVGIVTERDLLRAIDAQGAGALVQPASAIASKPLLTVPEDAFVYEAINRMRRHRIRHLGVVSEAGCVSGAVSARDLLRFADEAAVLLGSEMAEARDVAALARAWAKVPTIAADLLEGGLGGREIAAIVARQVGAITRCAGAVAESQLLSEGAGPPPCSYALLVLGSAGRGESLLALDQDNAIIFASGEPGGPVDRWFETFGARVNDTLQEIGIPLCPGGVMARNAEFRGSIDTWRSRIARWIDRAGPEELLSVDIFFDFRFVLGEEALADTLWREAWQAAGRARRFLRLLAESTSTTHPPIGLMGRLQTKSGRVDLKRFGLLPIVQSARFLALRHGLPFRSTVDRLNQVRALDVGGARDLAGAVAAHERFLLLILHAQLSDLAAGRSATNSVPREVIGLVAGLDQLKSDLRLAASLDVLARDQVATAST